MVRGSADIFNKEQLEYLLTEILKTNPKPLIMETAFKLSFFAGLRAQEIAGLKWYPHVFSTDGTFRVNEYPLFGVDGNVLKDVDGNVSITTSQSLFIGRDIGKYKRERYIPLNPSLADTLTKLYAQTSGDIPVVIPSGKKGAKQDLERRAHALTMRINRIYKALGMQGASSHSGRRSFITRGARMANAHGCSLKDVQKMAGHQSLVTTQDYIDDTPEQSKLVANMW